MKISANCLVKVFDGSGAFTELLMGVPAKLRSDASIELLICVPIKFWQMASLKFGGLTKGLVG
jgi:hypothetical protein